MVKMGKVQKNPVQNFGRSIKRNKGLKSLWKTIVEFGENTSFHGVKYMVSEHSSLFEK